MTQQKRHAFFVNRLRDYQDSERFIPLLPAYYVYRQYCANIVYTCVLIGGLLLWSMSMGWIRRLSPEVGVLLLIGAPVGYALLCYRAWIWLSLRERMHLAIPGPELELLESEDPRSEDVYSIHFWFNLKSHSSVYGRP